MANAQSLAFLAAFALLSAWLVHRAKRMQPNEYWTAVLVLAAIAYYAHKSSVPFPKVELFQTADPSVTLLNVGSHVSATIGNAIQKVTQAVKGSNQKKTQADEELESITMDMYMSDRTLRTPEDLPIYDIHDKLDLERLKAAFARMQGEYASIDAFLGRLKKNDRVSYDKLLKL